MLSAHKNSVGSDTLRCPCSRLVSKILRYLHGSSKPCRTLDKCKAMISSDTTNQDISTALALVGQYSCFFFVCHCSTEQRVFGSRTRVTLPQGCSLERLTMWLNLLHVRERTALAQKLATSYIVKTYAFEKEYLDTLLESVFIE